MTSSTNPIQHSFELAAARCEDLTPLVYRRLFREHPEASSMFRSEGSELVKGSMLALTIGAILILAWAVYDECGITASPCIRSGAKA
jgi:hemoglobin-like flavoprotein